MSFTATKFSHSLLSVPVNSSTSRSNDKPLTFSSDLFRTNPSSSFLGSTRKLLRFNALNKPFLHRRPSAAASAPVALEQTSNLVTLDRFLCEKSLFSFNSYWFSLMGFYKKLNFTFFNMLLRNLYWTRLGLWAAWFKC